MSCWRCGGQGYIVTCCDDMCRGSGECMHGDGEEVCPECLGQDDVDEFDWDDLYDDQEQIENIITGDKDQDEE